jgi:ubiquinone/menaquinone biosynthesis C-methylase UbiE
MTFYEDRVLPRMIDLMLGNAKMGKLRERALEGISGRVLEVGFGSGTNLPYYPSSVTELLAIDPAVAARRLATKRLGATKLPVEFIGLDGQHVPLEDNSVDNVASTWTLCTIPDMGLALSEIRRVLRPGGELFFLEHGHSTSPAVAARQARFEPLQKKIAGGCHLTRDHRTMIELAGLEITQLSTFQIAGPKITGFMYAGRARKAA